jgi:hypothetical protein
MSLRDVVMGCGFGLSGLAVVMAMLTIFWEEGPVFLLTWPRWFVLGGVLVFASML